MPTSTLKIDLHISAEEFVEWYRGTARDVLARSHDGRSVQFPAALLQKFIAPDGVHGTFLLTINEQNRFVKIEKCPPWP